MEIFWDNKSNGFLEKVTHLAFEGCMNNFSIEFRVKIDDVFL